MRQQAVWIAALALIITACGGGEDPPVGAVREQKDPRTVPSATVPAVIPTFQAAVIEAGQAPRRPTTTPDTYTVKEGDTPAGIAASLGVDLNELLRLNNIGDPTSLKVGQVLKVPKPPATPTPTRTPAATGTARPGATASATGTARPGTSPTAAARTATPAAPTASTYTVVEGDTGCGIATKLGVPLSALAAANNTTPQGLASLRIGQSLRVPSTGGDPGC